MEDFFSRLCPTTPLTEANLLDFRAFLRQNNRSPVPLLSLSVETGYADQVTDLLGLCPHVTQMEVRSEGGFAAFEVSLSSFRASVQLAWLLTLASQQAEVPVGVRYPRLKQVSEPQEAKGSAKLTARFFIVPPATRGFDVSRKIIGVGGKNMKSILKACEQKLGAVVSSNGNLKLRLRGRGSNFLEGPLQRECDERLHLCVSAKTREVLEEACKAVEKLLKSVGKQFASFCKEQKVACKGSFFERLAE